MQQNDLKTLEIAKKYLKAIKQKTPKVSCKVLLDNTRKQLAYVCDLDQKVTEAYELTKVDFNKDSLAEMQSRKVKAVKCIDEVLSKHNISEI